MTDHDQALIEQARQYLEQVERMDNQLESDKRMLEHLSYLRNFLNMADVDTQAEYATQIKQLEQTCSNRISDTLTVLEQMQQVKPYKLCDVLNKYYIDGLTMTEIGEVLYCSERTIRRYYQAALLAFGKVLQNRNSANCSKT